MPTVVRSFSKVNLGLAVGPVRADGFHGLVTLYQTLALHDLVTVAARRAAVTAISLRCERGGVRAEGVPQTATGDAEKNTAWRMVAGALRRLGVTAEVEIAIDKRLPVQGGMGAGSANAAAALLGLERELGVALGEAERLVLAAEVGSDVPLFLIGGAVLGVGRGEKVSALPDLPRVRCVVAVPGVGVSTAAAFRELDRRMGEGARGQGIETKSQGLGARGQGVGKTGDLGGGGSEANSSPSAPDDSVGGGAASQLTFQQGSDRLSELSRVLSEVFGMNVSGTKEEQAGPSGIGRNAPFDRDSDFGLSATGSRKPFGTKGDGTAIDLAENALLALVRTGVENDFEEVAFSQHPSLRDIKRALLGRASALPDEGACLYAALSGSGSALFGLYGSDEAAVAAQQRVREAGADALLTETLPRTEYWKRMFAE